MVQCVRIQFLSRAAGGVKLPGKCLSWKASIMWPWRSGTWLVPRGGTLMFWGSNPGTEGMWNGVPVFVGKGHTALALFPAREHALSPTSRGDRIGMLHLAFRATRAEFLAAQDDLKSRGISFAFQDHEISHSIYFHDPDGNRLEITTYEVGDSATTVA